MEIARQRVVDEMETRCREHKIKVINTYRDYNLEAMYRIEQCTKYKLTSLDLTYLHLEDLTDIWKLAVLSPHNDNFSKFPYLHEFKETFDTLLITTLDCSFNQMYRFPSGLPFLIESLDCSSNRISTWPEKLPPKLKYLNCGKNSLSQLPKKLLDNLEVLICNNNPLKIISETFFTKLHTLNCESCELTELPDVLPATLMTLHCGHNKLTKLPKNLPMELTELYCNHNNLTELPEYLPKKLRELNCEWNELTELPEYLHEELTTLRCNNNKLKKLPKTLPSRLYLLNCCKNKLLRLPKILPITLRWLWCKGNTLIELPELLPPIYQISTFYSYACNHNRHSMECGNHYLYVSNEMSKKFGLQETENYSMIFSRLKEIYLGVRRIQQLLFCEKMSYHMDEYRYRPNGGGLAEVKERNKGKFIDL